MEPMEHPCRSVRTSRTTVAATRSMASGCVCAPARAARSSRPVGARAAPHSRSESVLPKERRLRRRDEIAHVIRTGRRAGTSTLVVHAADATGSAGARLGLVVGKSVGNSVVRHRVARRLRHVFAADRHGWDEAGLDVVVRALPAAAAATSAGLGADLGAGRERLVRRREEVVRP